MPKTPSLAHDKMMKERFGTEVDANGKLERRIVFNLCLHLESAGFRVVEVYDGEEENKVSTPKDAMELIFNLDEASLRFQKDGFDDDHGVLIIIGNGIDIISDWSYYHDDSDGFNAAMEKFNVEDFA